MTNAEAIRRLIRNERMTAEEICNRLGINRIAVSTAMNCIENQGTKIVREKINQDGRKRGRLYYRIASESEAKSIERRKKGQRADEIATYLTSGDKWTMMEIACGLGVERSAIASYIYYMRDKLGYDIKSERTIAGNQRQYWIETETQND